MKLASRTDSQRRAVVWVIPASAASPERLRSPPHRPAQRRTKRPNAGGPPEPGRQRSGDHEVCKLNIRYSIYTTPPRRSRGGRGGGGGLAALGLEVLEEGGDPGGFRGGDSGARLAGHGAHLGGPSPFGHPRGEDGVQRMAPPAAVADEVELGPALRGELLDGPADRASVGPERALEGVAQGARAEGPQRRRQKATTKPAWKTHVSSKSEKFQNSAEVFRSTPGRAAKTTPAAKRVTVFSESDDPGAGRG